MRMLAPAILEIFRMWLPLLPIIAPTLPDGTKRVTVSEDDWATFWFPPETLSEFKTLKFEKFVSSKRIYRIRLYFLTKSLKNRHFTRTIDSKNKL